MLKYALKSATGDTTGAYISVSVYIIYCIYHLLETIADSCQDVPSIIQRMYMSVSNAYIHYTLSYSAAPRKIRLALKCFRYLYQNNTIAFNLIPTITKVNSVSLTPLCEEIPYSNMLFILPLAYDGGSVEASFPSNVAAEMKFELLDDTGIGEPSCLVLV